jgi:lipopolysaccharide export system protein LptC
MSARNITTFTVLLFVALGTWYLASSLQSTEVVEPVSNRGSDGFYLKSARILGTDQDGLLLYEIEADFIQQQESNDIAMQNVQISYSDGSQVPWTITADAATISEDQSLVRSQVPWTITADAATISEDQSLVRLSGHVIAVSEAGFEGQVTEIRSPQLDIEPVTYKAETDSRVQIRIGSRSLTATGMLALLQDNQLQLRSNVSGKFVP